MPLNFCRESDYFWWWHVSFCYFIWVIITDTVYLEISKKLNSTLSLLPQPFLVSVNTCGYFNLSVWDFSFVDMWDHQFPTLGSLWGKKKKSQNTVCFPSECLSFRYRPQKSRKKRKFFQDILFSRINLGTQNIERVNTSRPIIKMQIPSANCKRLISLGIPYNIISQSWIFFVAQKKKRWLFCFMYRVKGSAGGSSYFMQFCTTWSTRKGQWRIREKAPYICLLSLLHRCKYATFPQFLDCCGQGCANNDVWREGLRIVQDHLWNICLVV